jgi:hypothetical protein
VGRRLSLPRLTGTLAFHQALLADARRNPAFHRALAARIRPGSGVLDRAASDALPLARTPLTGLRGEG